MNSAQTLQRHLSEARNGAGSVLEIRAPFGGGKTTLIERLRGEQGEGLVLSRPAARHRLTPLLCEMILDCAEGARALDPGDEARPWLLPGPALIAASSWRVGLDPITAGVYSQLLLQLSEARFICLIIDDAHALDAGSRIILEQLAGGLDEGHRLAVLLLSAPVGAPLPHTARVALGGLEEAEARAQIAELWRGAPLTEEATRRLLEEAAGNPLILARALELLGRGALEGATERVTWRALATGEVEAPPQLREDLGGAAVLGARLTPELFAAVRDLRAQPEEALTRLDALVDAGLLARRGEGYIFPSAGLAEHIAAGLPEAERRRLHGAAFEGLRAPSERPPVFFEPPRKMAIDVTDTWSADRRRARRRLQQLDALLDAHQHALAAERPLDAAEAAVTLAERLLAYERHGYSARDRVAWRRWRHRMRWALGASARLLEAQPAPEDRRAHLIAQIRHHLAAARLHQGDLDFAAARQALELAKAAQIYLGDPQMSRVVSAREVELRYAAGDFHEARRALSALMAALAGAPDAEAIPAYIWLSEQLARWEWVGLHQQLFPEICGALRARGATVEAMRAEMEQLSAAIALDEGRTATRLLDDITRAALREGHLPQLAEQLALYAAELIQLRVDVYHDGLSGEFFTPDLSLPMEPSEGLMTHLAGPIDLFTRAEAIAEDAKTPLTHLRVLNTLLGVIYETRERLVDLLERWRSAHPEIVPPLLLDAVEALEVGFFEVEHVEGLVLQVVELSQRLGLDQVLGNTLYEALDRDLPSAVRRMEHYFALASSAYARVDDLYGAITLALVEHRYLRIREGEVDALLARVDRLMARVGELGEEHRAFIHLRLGEILLDEEAPSPERVAVGRAHLEDALEAYSRAGDVEQMIFVGDRLSTLYREAGDLMGYRRLRARFQALERSRPGVDPLGLEMRIEHLLTLARGEPDDEKAIERLERCAHLYQRIPGGGTRLDECFVEISKICRRRADEATNEAGFHHWLGRSLSAVERAVAINKRRENHHRLFEELHELFDDLLGLEQQEAYLRVRAEARALAFSVGNIGELFYLFEEHLQINPEAGFDAARLPEIRGFYEGFALFLNGLGVGEHAKLLLEMFIQFLERVGEDALATRYRGGAEP